MNTTYLPGKTCAFLSDRRNIVKYTVLSSKKQVQPQRLRSCQRREMWVRAGEDSEGRNSDPSFGPSSGQISPLMPGSCRYLPTCSEYAMEAYEKYGVGKGTVLTAWRICRCNPLGSSGYDPPVWFGEKKK
mmetsp:Transcript_34484/g.47783  ORF Transcript_34484/g.47783 Transcript_34484/m.47783 type:complete len:130 (+) Transcript_34484:167-556(+)